MNKEKYDLYLDEFGKLTDSREIDKSYERLKGQPDCDIDALRKAHTERRLDLFWDWLFEQAYP